MNTYALVIQGPVRDSRFDAWANILDIFEAYGHLFDQVILSTWEGHELGIEKLPNGMELALTSDPFSSTQPWPDNRLRQWASTMAGLDKVRKGVTHVVKVRSDQFFDLKMFLEEFEEACSSHQGLGRSRTEGFLHSLALIRGLSFAVCDFAMVGSERMMREFYSAQLKHAGILLTGSVDTPESDSVRKYLYEILPGEFPGLEGIATMPKLDATLTRKRKTVASSNPTLHLLWEYALREVFSISSIEVMRSLRWRGHPIPRDYLSATFEFKPSWLKKRQMLCIELLIEYQPWNRFLLAGSFLAGRSRVLEGRRGFITKVLIAIQAGHIRHANGSIFWRPRGLTSEQSGPPDKRDPVHRSKILSLADKKNFLRKSGRSLENGGDGGI